MGRGSPGLRLLKSHDLYDAPPFGGRFPPVITMGFRPPGS